MAVAAAHILFVKIPEKKIAHDPELENKKIDLKGSMAAIRAVPGLAWLIVFTTFNNLVGGVYMALMDPYGLTLFPVELWGIVLGVTSTGFIVAPLAQFVIIPYMQSDAGRQAWGWLLGDGEARGIALVFLVASIIMLVVVLLAFKTRAYRRLSEFYQKA